jgi:hypothetical protein
MSRHRLPHVDLPPRRSAPPWGWEPALSQLRQLARPELDNLVALWAAAFSIHSVRPDCRTSRAATYHGLLGDYPLGLPVRIRLCQRRNRLQVHHVEAFAGHCARLGVPFGILATTAGCGPEAARIAASYRSPQLRLYTGPQWAEELAAHRIGVRRRTVPQWVIEVAASLRRPCSTGSLRPERRV